MACYGAGSASATISLPNGTVDINGNSSLNCCDCGGGGGGGVVLTCSDPTACNYNSPEACIFGNPCGTTFQVRAAMAGQSLDVFGNIQWCGTINVSVGGGAELISDNDNPSARTINRIYRTYVSTPVSVSFSPVACSTNAITQTYCCGNNPDGSASPGCPQGGSAFIEVLEGCAAQPAGCFASVGQWDCGDTVRGDCESEHNRGISYTITPCLEIDCNC
jgi:hypothetical protein